MAIEVLQAGEGIAANTVNLAIRAYDLELDIYKVNADYSIHTLQSVTFRNWLGVSPDNSLNKLIRFTKKG